MQRIWQFFRRIWRRWFDPDPPWRMSNVRLRMGLNREMTLYEALRLESEDRKRRKALWDAGIARRYVN